MTTKGMLLVKGVETGYYADIETLQVYRLDKQGTKFINMGKMHPLDYLYYMAKQSLNGTLEYIVATVDMIEGECYVSSMTACPSPLAPQKI